MPFAPVGVVAAVPGLGGRPLAAAAEGLGGRVEELLAPAPAAVVVEGAEEEVAVVYCV